MFFGPLYFPGRLKSTVSCSAPVVSDCPLSGLTEEYFSDREALVTPLAPDLDRPRPATSLPPSKET